MKFESRIKHIEQKIGAGALQFCTCQGDSRYPRTETVYYENGKPATSADLINQTLPDACETCGKPIHKMTIIIDFIDSMIPKPKEAQ